VNPVALLDPGLVPAGLFSDHAPGRAADLETWFTDHQNLPTIPKRFCNSAKRPTTSLQLCKAPDTSLFTPTLGLYQGLTVNQTVL